ncbi:MAG: HEAT repeat domain-containing protein [Acidobacteriaceae bacterium]
MKKQMVLIVLAGLLAWIPPALSQGAQPKQASSAATTSNNQEEPDVPVAKPAKSVTTVQSQTNTAWDMLNTAQANTAAKAEQIRIDAVIALGTLGNFSRAVEWLTTARKDPDRYVRMAAVTTMGASKNPVFLSQLKEACNDPAPEVSFAAAVGLWKMNDHSGERILEAVAGGDRTANRGLVSSEKHEADQDLHSRSKLEQIGLEQGAYAVLGPFGLGLSAMRSFNGKSGIHPRVVAATLLEENQSPAAMKIFINAMDDPDPLVRAAAAKALGDYHTQDAMEALSDGFYDIKPAVRLMSAASYLRAVGPEAKDNPHQQKHTLKSSSR